MKLAKRCSNRNGRGMGCGSAAVPSSKTISDYANYEIERKGYT
jgi:hypothetical protein